MRQIMKVSTSWRKSMSASHVKLDIDRIGKISSIVVSLEHKRIGIICILGRFSTHRGKTGGMRNQREQHSPSPLSTQTWHMATTGVIIASDCQAAQSSGLVQVTASAAPSDTASVASTTEHVAGHDPNICVPWGFITRRRPLRHR